MRYKLYIYGQHHSSAGMLCYSPELVERFEDENEGCDDIFLWGEGESESMIEQAITRLGKRYETRASGNSDRFDWKCCLNVLEYLDGPEVEFDSAKMVYVVAVEEDIDD